MSVHDTALRVGASAAINLGIARADIPSRVIPFRSITLSGFYAAGDLGAGAVYVQGTSSGPMAIQDAAGTWWNLAVVDSINPGHFGAKGDGSTDDTAAINAAMDAVRASYTNASISQGQIIGVRFPCRVYKVLGSLNFTGIKSFNFVVDGNGAIIHGACAGKAVIDALNSRWVTWNNLSIWGDAATPPAIGIQIGRALTVASSAGDSTFDTINIQGNYTLASLYVHSCETNQYRHVRLYNNYASDAAFCMISDARNYYNVPSDFVAQQNAVDAQTYSFNENSFLGCDFRRVTGPVIQMVGNTSRHTYSSCYAATATTQIVETLKSDAIVDLHFDVHTEVGPGLQRIFLIDNVNPTSNLGLYGWRIRDHQPQCNASFIDFTGTTRGVLFDNFGLDAGTPAYAVPIFGAGAGAVSKVQVSGHIYWPSSLALNLSNCYFNGDVLVKDGTSITHAPGTYRVIRRPNGSTFQTEMHKGLLQIFGTGAGTNADNGFELEGQATGTSPVSRVAGVDANLYWRRRGKGTGGTQDEDGVGNVRIKTDTTGVGFNGAATVGKATLAAALVTDGSATNASIATLLNQIRAALIAVGLAQ